MKTQSASANGDQSNLNTGREWSAAELLELGDLLMYEISTKEIAWLLERDHGDVQDKSSRLAGLAVRWRYHGVLNRTGPAASGQGLT